MSMRPASAARTVEAVVVLRVVHCDDLLLGQTVSEDADEVEVFPLAVWSVGEDRLGLVSVQDEDARALCGEEVFEDVCSSHGERLGVVDGEETDACFEDHPEVVHDADLLVVVDRVVQVRAGQIRDHLEQAHVVFVEVLLVAVLVCALVDRLDHSFDFADRVEDRDCEDRLGLEAGLLVRRRVEALVVVGVSDVQRVRAGCDETCDAFGDRNPDGVRGAWVNRTDPLRLWTTARC